MTDSDLVWSRIIRHQGEVFRQMRGKPFTYEMITERSDRRAVQLRVREFEQADHLDLELSSGRDVEGSQGDTP